MSGSVWLGLFVCGAVGVRGRWLGGFLLGLFGLVRASVCYRARKTLELLWQNWLGCGLQPALALAALTGGGAAICVAN